jgi:hypothetical protein
LTRINSDTYTGIDERPNLGRKIEGVLEGTLCIGALLYVTGCAEEDGI